mgnify:CR=1 FL=1
MNLPRIRLFWAVSLGHLTNDIFMSMGPVLLAFLSAHVLPITNTQIGAAISAQQLVGAMSQPLFGWLADRGGSRLQRWLGAGGVAWVIGLLMLSLTLALTGQFWLMVVPFALAALGSGAFHPVGTMLAAESDGSRAASSLSYFFLLGQGGLALGPALAGFLLDQANPAGSGQVTVAPLYVLALLATPAVAFMALSITRSRLHPSVPLTSPAQGAGEPPVSVSLPIRAIALLALLVALRSLATPGSVAFIPRLFQQKGWDPTEYGLITSSFWIASGVAGVIFGQLADRYDRRYVIMLSLLLAVPALFFLPTVEGKLIAFGLAIAAGALTGGSHSVLVVLAQGMIPGSKGFASGATLGFMFATGALGSFVIGGLSDQIGLGTAFQIVAGAAVLAGLLALLLPAGRAQRPREALDATTPETEAEALPSRAR